MAFIIGVIIGAGAVYVLVSLNIIRIGKKS
jgi:hypothetical protein